MKKCVSFPRFPKKVTRLSSILFAVGAFSYSSSAFADVNGIPYNPDFPNAQNPYAQAPDGCSGWQNTRQVRDTWGRVSFTEACNNHDRCYYTRGSNWNTCNEGFYSDLRAACERDLRVWVPPVTVRGVEITPGFHTPPEPATLSSCYTVASGYYAGVQAGVLLDVFEEAQDKQRRYEEWVANLSNPTPTTAAGNYRLSDGTIFFSNASDAYCTYISSEHIVLTGNREIRSADSLPSFRNDGSCPVMLPAGAYRLVDGRIIASNGNAFCRYVSYEHYERKDGRPIRQLSGEVPLHAMENHFDCAQ